MFESCDILESVFTVSDPEPVGAELACGARDLLESAVRIGRIDASRSAALRVQLDADSAGAPAADSRAEAEVLQARLGVTDRRARREEARRTTTMLAAYETSMRDPAERFGPGIGIRQGPGARSFFISTGLVLGRSPRWVSHLVDTGLTLLDRLPETWDRYLVGDATWTAVDIAAAQSRDLPEDLAGAYDEAAAALVATVPVGRLKKRLRRVRERLRDETADERAEATRRRRTAFVEQGDDGEASFVLTGPAAEITAFDHALTKAAVAAHGVDGEDRTIPQLRHDIAKDLLVEGIKQAASGEWSGLTVPGRKGVAPTVVLTIPALSALGRSQEQADLAGYGPMSGAVAKRLAAEAASFVRVLTDPVTGLRLSMDRTARLAPTDMRRWVQSRDDTCRFPACVRPAHLCDLDHVLGWQQLGVTDTDNRVALCRSDHIAKTLRLWREQLDADGTVDWENPGGAVFTDPAPPGPDPAPPRIVEWASHAAPDDCPF